MGTWGFLVDVLAPAAGGLLLIALGWAAIERGRVHAGWVRLPGERVKEAAQMVDRCVAGGTAAGLV